MKVAALTALTALAGSGYAQFDLGTASHFALLAAGAVVNIGPLTKVIGDVGSAAAVEGFPDGTIVGTAETNNADTAGALTDAMNTFNAARAAAPGGIQVPDDKLIHGTVLNNTVFTPGLYSFAEQIFMDGDVILTGAGNYTFVVGNKLNTLDGVSVILTAGALPQNVLWVVDNEVTLAPNVGFQGNIITISEIFIENAANATGTLVAFGPIHLGANAITDPNV